MKIVATVLIAVSMLSVAATSASARHHGHKVCHMHHHHPVCFWRG
jgi:hypothetical protein